MKRTIKIPLSLAVLYLAFIGYVKITNHGNPLFMDYRYNTVITQPLAKMGCANAQYKMGHYWLYGSGESEPTKQEIENAVYWWEKASVRGNDKATKELARAKNQLDRLKNPLYSELSFIKNYIGKYPSDIDFFNIPVIRERLQNLAGEHFDQISKCAVESLISEFEKDYIHTRICFPHECHQVFCEIFINHVTDNISLYYQNYDNHYFLSENGKIGIEFDKWK